MLIGGSLLSFVQSPCQYSGVFTPVSIAAILFVAIGGTLIAFICYLESLKYIAPYEASIFACVEPLSAAILSMVFLGVVFTPVQWLGTVCIIVTITALSLMKDKEDTKAKVTIEGVEVIEAVPSLKGMEGSVAPNE